MQMVTVIFKILSTFLIKWEWLQVERRHKHFSPAGVAKTLNTCIIIKRFWVRIPQGVNFSLFPSPLYCPFPLWETSKLIFPEINLSLIFWINTIWAMLLLTTLVVLVSSLSGPHESWIPVRTIFLLNVKIILGCFLFSLFLSFRCRKTASYF